MTDKLCAAPWVHLHTFPSGQVYPCCLTPMEFPVGNLNNQSLEEVWNNEKIRNIRKQMIAGIEPESCKRCFEQEKHGKDSFREHMNQTFPNYENLIQTTAADGSLDNMDLRYWDFRFSNICNMKCRSCGPQLSTGWYEDTKKIWGSLPNDIPDKIKQFDLWDQILPFFDTVEEIYFAGGEPLIMEEHYRILKKLEEIDRYDVRLKYNTNFSQMKYKKLDALETWAKFKDVEVGASFDGYGKQAEYIRKGTDWDQIYQNRLKQKEIAPNVNFFVNFTLSVMNSLHIIDFHHYAVESKLIDTYDNLHINFVHSPEHMSLQALPPKLKETVKAAYKKHISFLKENLQNRSAAQFESSISFMESEDKYILNSKFKDYMKTLDDIRNESFIDTFPELKEMLE
jgi:radical SAM protein with 4Fe4S-binding SPASM domain